MKPFHAFKCGYVANEVQLILGFSVKTLKMNVWDKGLIKIFQTNKDQVDVGHLKD